MSVVILAVLVIALPGGIFGALRKFRSKGRAQ